jgi:hypothetical protein
MQLLKKETNVKQEVKEAMKEVQQEDYRGFQKDEILTPEEAQSKIALLLAETQSPDLMSELGGEEIKLLSALQTVASETKAGILNDFILNFLRMRVSLKRQGRKEILDVSKGGIGAEEKMRKSMKSMILGLR